MTPIKVKSMRGKPLDLNTFIQQHAEKPAIRPAGGASRLNARGDKIGPGGRIEQTAEQMRTEYNRSNPKAVSKQVALKNIQQEIFSNSVSPSEAVKQALKPQPETLPAKKRKLVDPDS